MVDVKIVSDPKSVPNTETIVSFIEDLIIDGIVCEDTIDHHEIKTDVKNGVLELILYRQPAPDGGMEVVRAIEGRIRASASFGYKSITISPSQEPESNEV